jgi:uncharacterized protein
MVDQSIIDTAKRYIQQVPDDLELKAAFLFGSHAKGLERNDSDIDIALVIGKMDNFFEVQMRLMRLRRKVDLRIEPHPILFSEFTNENPLAYEVQTTGIELK